MAFGKLKQGYPCLHGLVLLVLLASLLGIPRSPAFAAGRTFYVSINGADNNPCSAAEPCRSIQQAINIAGTGDTILVSAGTYAYNPDLNACAPYLDTPAVACVADKNLTINGGYAPGNWSSYAPSANLTIIDGLGQTRGFAIITVNTAASAVIRGFTVQNGIAQGVQTTDGAHSRGFGGGLIAHRAAINLSDMVFANNVAKGADGYAGWAFGGAIGIEQTASGTNTLSNIVFTNNRALGGSGSSFSGPALGGALVVAKAVLNGSDLVFTNNLARGGNNTGDGRNPGNRLPPEGLGGAAALTQDTTVSFTRVRVENNQAIGGNSSGYAGRGLGGGLYYEGNTGTISDSFIDGNLAQGGSAQNWCEAFGGGIAAELTSLSIDRTTLRNNMAAAGDCANDAVTSVSGGGAFFGDFAGKTSGLLIRMNNVIVADNATRAFQQGPGLGGGAGINIFNIKAEIQHATFANNRFEGQMDMGLAILVNQSNSAMQTTLLMSNSIISDHTRYFNPYTTLIAIPPECKGIIGGLMTSLNTIPYFDLGERDPKLSGDVTINNHIELGHTPIGYVSPSAPDFDYHLTANSPAVNSAPSIGLAVDIDGDTRPVGTAPDFGADEMYPQMVVSPTRIDMMIDDTGSEIWAYVEEFHKSNLTWSSTSNAAWVQLNPAGGSTPQLVSVEIDPSRMALGNNSAQIVITSPNAGSATIQLNITRAEKIYRTFQPIILR